MTKITAGNLPDMQQSTTGFHKKYIDKVGVEGIKVPLRLKAPNKEGYFDTIATISSFCDLVPELKGINMSRIGRTINDLITENEKFPIDSMDSFLYKLKEAHGTDNIYIKAEFEYIIEDEAPMTEIFSFEPVQVVFESSLIGDVHKRYITVTTTEMSLCPCSKEMSSLLNNVTEGEAMELSELSSSLLRKIENVGFGAHNQKSFISVTAELTDNKSTLWIEDLVKVMKRSSSCSTTTVLKRPDEKFVTEVSYMSAYINDNKEIVDVPGYGPKFVEDIAREVAFNLDKSIGTTISDYEVAVRNQESIHTDEIVATAFLSYKK